MTDQQATGFPEALIALGQHMQLTEGLASQVHSVCWRFYRGGYRDGLEIVLHADYSTVDCLMGWARTLTDVSSDVRRLRDGSVHASVYGQLADVAVRVWTRVPGDGFPEEPGTHEWDVTVQLQEA